MAIINKVKNQEKDTKNLFPEESLPQYEHLFDEDNDKKYINKNDGEKVHLIRKVYLMNFWTTVFATFIALIQISPTIVVPFATGEIINIITEIVNDGYQSSYLLPIITYVVLSVVTILLNGPTTMLRYKILCKTEKRVDAGIKYSVVRKLQAMSITYHKDMQMGKVQAKFLNSVTSINSYIHSINFVIIPQILSCVVSVVVSVIKNGWVSLFFLFVIPLNLLFTRLFRNKIRKSSRASRISSEELSAKFNTMIDMMPVTKSHGLEKKQISQLSSYISDTSARGYELDNVVAKFGSFMFVSSNILSFACLCFCSWLAIIGKIGIGDIVLFQTLFTSISGYISSIVGQIPTFSAGKEGINAISEVMSVKEVENNIFGDENESIEGSVEFKNVYYCYPRSAPYVLKDFSLKVDKGECIAVVGASGSGKSTIMNMIIGFLLPSMGDVFIDGKNIKDINLSLYRHNISVVPQNSILFDGTIRENITYGLDVYSDEQLNRVVEMANLNEFLKDLPNGLDTRIGEHGDKLSGGQKQRITIARALIRNPKILILDEATSALDNISEYHVQKAIEQATRGRTTFIVAHRLSTIRNADRIVVMEEGSCVECGSFDELMAKKGKFYELKNLNDATSKKAEEALS